MANEYADLREMLEEKFDKNDENEFILDDGSEKLLIAKRWDNIVVTYNKGKLKEKFEKEMYNKMIDVNYSVDMAKLREMVRSGEIERKVANKFIMRNESVSNAKIESLYDTCEINSRQLKGCFDIKTTKVMKISRNKRT